jgi:hypothetical protein
LLQPQCATQQQPNAGTTAGAIKKATTTACNTANAGTIQYIAGIQINMYGKMLYLGLETFNRTNQTFLHFCISTQLIA